jgi:hypothetical protein
VSIGLCAKVCILFDLATLQSIIAALFRGGYKPQALPKPVRDRASAISPYIARSVGRHKASPLPSEAGGKGDSLNEGATDHRQVGSALTSPIMLDPENWKIVFAVYNGRSISALALAYQLIAIKQSLERGRKGIPDAIKGLDLAIDGLYPHTDFHKVGHKFFLRTIEGNLTPKQEERLRELGIKF